MSWGKTYFSDSPKIPSKFEDSEFFVEQQTEAGSVFTEDDEEIHYEAGDYVVIVANEGGPGEDLWPGTACAVVTEAEFLRDFK